MLQLGLNISRVIIPVNIIIGVFDIVTSCYTYTARSCHYNATVDNVV